MSENETATEGHNNAPAADASSRSNTASADEAENKARESGAPPEVLDTKHVGEDAAMSIAHASFPSGSGGS